MTSRWNNATMASGLWRFMSAGLDDAVRRLARLTARVAPDEARVVRLVEASAAVGAVDRVLGHLRTAARSSVIVGAIATRWDAWRSQPATDRTRGTGIALLTAAGFHLLLSLWQRPVAGWLWLIVPSLVAVIGALMALAPSRGLVRE